MSCGAFFWSLIYAPLFDYADMTVPKRYFIFEALHNGIFPLWNPYQSMGSPEHIDANIFYLPLYIFAVFGKYSPFLWGVESIFYGFIAGYGFFIFCKHFTKSEKAAFIAAVCYMTSGVVVSNAQHFTWIIGLAWLPYLLHYFISLLETPNLKTSLLTSIFGALLFTGSYPGYIFVLPVLLLFIIIHYIILKRKEQNYLKCLFVYGFISILACIILVLPYLISIIQASSYIFRGSALQYDQVAQGVSFTWQSLISLIFPYITCINSELTHTDISMGNIFIGIIPLIFAVIGIRKVKNNVMKILIFWGIFCGLVAFGNALPVHRLAFYTIPFFNFIRLPSFFRIFLVISLLLLVVNGFDKYEKCNAKKRRVNVIVIIICVEMLINTWICMQYTGFTKNFTNKQLAEMFSNLPKDYTIPQKVTTCTDIYHKHHFVHLWRNLGMMSNEIESSSYNPFSLKAYQYMLQPFETKKQELILSSVVFFPKEIIYSANPICFNTDTVYTSNRNLVKSYSNMSYPQISILEFSPKHIVINTCSQEERPLIVCQNNYSGWHATMENGNELPIMTMNTSLIALQIPSGNHTIRLYYSRLDLILSMILTLCMWIFITIYLIYDYLKNKKQ